jgi:hypothetical protein
MAKRLKDLVKLETLDDTSSVVIVSDNATNLGTLATLRTTMLTKASSGALGAVKVGTRLSISPTGVLSADNQIPTQGGNGGKFLTTDGSSVSWGTVTIPPSLPTQGGNGGKYLKTNGAAASWEYVELPELLPPRATNGGKFLSTDGTVLNWTAITGIPSQTSNANKILKTNGTSASWSSAIQIDGNDQITLTAGANKKILMQSPVVFPSYTQGDRDQLQAVVGTVIFNTSAVKLQVYTGVSWADLH